MHCSCHCTPALFYLSYVRITLWSLVQITSADPSRVEVLSPSGMVVGRQTGLTNVSINGAASVPPVQVEVTNDKSLTALYLEAFVSTQRLKYAGPSPFPHTATSEVELDVLPGLYGFNKTQAPIVVSAVLDDGSRMYITDHTRLTITSLDPSVVSVSNGVVTGLSPGSGELVEVTVCAGVELSANATVEVRLNRNRPEFNASNALVEVEESRQRGSVIYQVTAIDKDTSFNAEVEYAIVGTDHNGLFAVDTMTGEVSITEELDAEERQQYTLVIEATDFNQREFRALVAANATVPSHDHILNQADTIMVSCMQGKCVGWHGTLLCTQFELNSDICTVE